MITSKYLDKKNINLQHLMFFTFIYPEKSRFLYKKVCKSFVFGNYCYYICVSKKK